MTSLNKNEDNPFENEVVAKEWITSVENEQGRIRNNDIYPRLKNWLAEINPKTVIEIGSGQGICSDKLGDFRGQYIGVEPSYPLVKRANELYSHNKNRIFIVGNAYRLPVDRASADAVFSVNVWFHLEDLDGASRELAEILKINAHFLIITANPDNYSSWESFFYDYKKDAGKIDGKIKLPISDLSRNIFYMHSLTEIKEALERYCLEVVTTDNYGRTGEFGDQGLFVSIKGRKSNCDVCKLEE